jgi:hypothetical protein
MRYAKSVGTFAAGLSIAVIATVGTAPAFAGPITAGNGATQLEFNYRAADGTTFNNVQDLPGLQVPASLASQLSADWDDIRSTLCTDYIEGQAAQILQSNGGYTMKNWQCTLQANGTLQVSALSSNEVELSWVTPGNSISLNINAFSSPKISATFGASLNVDVNVDGALTANDGDPSGSPLTLASDSLSFDNADFTGSSLVPKSALQSADQTVDTMSVEASTLPTAPNFNQMVAVTNAFYHQVATTVYDTYLGVGATETFAVAAAVDNNVFVLTLARDGSAPATPPGGCSIAEYALQFQATCSQEQPPEVTGITIMETHLGWAGGVDAYENGSWLEESANGQPYADINAWEFPSTYPTVYLAACSANIWGYNCDPSEEFPNLDDPSSVPPPPSDPASPPLHHPPIQPVHPPTP